jgi:hypothetical protein
MTDKIYPSYDVKILSALEHICARPKMYFGDSATTSIELAAFLNGWMAHRSGFMCGGFGMECRADSDKTPEENGQIFLDQILAWDKAKAELGPWRCCVDAPKETK